MVEGIGVKVMEHSTVLIPVLLALLRDVDPVVVTQAIVSGTKLFSRVLEEMAMQVSLSFSFWTWYPVLGFYQKAAIYSRILTITAFCNYF